jgi:hypothetical protein
MIYVLVRPRIPVEWAISALSSIRFEEEEIYSSDNKGRHEGAEKEKGAVEFLHPTFITYFCCALFFIDSHKLGNCSEIWSAIRDPSILYNGCPLYQSFLS